MAREFLHILGVPNFANYEASASLIRVPKQGGLIDYVCIGEDRLTRLKHPYTFPLRGIDYCLQTFGLESLEQVDWIFTDYARLPRWLNSGPGYRKLEHDYLKVNLRYPRARIRVIDHHDAHAASFRVIDGPSRRVLDYLSLANGSIFVPHDWTFEPVEQAASMLS